MRVLVTGAAGFIGSHLLESLLQDRQITHVRAVDSFVTGRRENIAPFQDRIDFIEGSLLDADVCQRIVHGVDVIFHQAAIPSVPRSVDHPIESHLNGAHATILLLDAARQANVKRFVMAASSSAYGDTEIMPKREDLLPVPLSPYAATKLACEHYVSTFARCYAMDTVNLRYFNVFGPRQDPSSPYSGVVARFCEAFVHHRPITIYGDGLQSRDFTYVANVVQANLLAAKASQRLNGQTFNVGCGVRSTLLDMLRILNEIAAQSKAADFQPARGGDVKHSQADISRIRKVLEYEPAVDLREGLRRTLEWYRGNR